MCGHEIDGAGAESPREVAAASASVTLDELTAAILGACEEGIRLAELIDRPAVALALERALEDVGRALEPIE